MGTAADLVHAASDAAFAVDQRMRVVAWNRGAEEVLGYSSAEAVGRSCYSLLRAVLPDGQPLCTPHCSAVLSFGRCLPYAARSCLCRRKDGAWVKASLSSLTVLRSFPDEGVLAVVLLHPLDGTVAPVPAQSILRVFTLGHFGLAAGDRGIPIAGWGRKQALTLLKLLVAHRGRPVHRDRLIEYLWPEAPDRQGRERLKVVVHLLRQRLQQAGLAPDVVATAREAYILQRESLWVDVDALEELVLEGQAQERHQNGAEALRLYREAEDLYGGDYMEEELYADWCAAERERLRERHLDLLGRMAGLYADQGNNAEAAQVCRKALVREPCRESFHRALMEYLWRLGRRDEALAQFRSCAAVLAQEMGVEPLPETQRLHRQLLELPHPTSHAVPTSP